jgi:hypothetical protein
MKTASKPTSTIGSESCNSINGEFDFGHTEEAASACTLHPVGTWNAGPRALTRAQHEARLVAAEACVLCIAGPPRLLFAACLRAQREALEQQLKSQCHPDDAVFALAGQGPYLDRAVTDAGLPAFFAHCLAHDGAHEAGLVYKVRRALTVQSAAVHVPGLGSLTVRRWEGGGFGLAFCLIERDRFFLASYQDGQPALEAPYAVWRKCCSVQNLIKAGYRYETAALSSFAIAGREYVQLGGSYHNTKIEACAWRVGSLADWRGPIFNNYHALIAACNAGTVELGDHRGLLVRVRGGVCVLVSAALLYDGAEVAFGRAHDQAEAFCAGDEGLKKKGQQDDEAPA